MPVFTSVSKVVSAIRTDPQPTPLQALGRRAWGGGGGGSKTKEKYFKIVIIKFIFREH